MKILIYGINYAPEPTGVGKYSGEMGKWLSEQGHDVRVVTAPPYYPAWKIGKGHAAWKYKKETIDGVKVWRCPLWVPDQVTGMNRLIHLFSFAISSFPVAFFLSLFWRPDVVFNVAPALVSTPGGWLAARVGGAKAWLHIQDFEVDAAYDLGILKVGKVGALAFAVERWLFRRFDRISTISHKMMARLSLKEVPTEKQVFFPNWVDTETIQPIEGGADFMRDELDLPQDKVLALYSGNMGEKQGLDMLIQAARKMPDEDNTMFVLCGDGTARERLVGQAAGLKNIRFLPLQPFEKLNALLNMADVHLLPQRANAADLVMPSKLTGMLSCGGAVVVMAHPGTGVATVVDAAGGKVCTPEDIGELVQHLAELSADQEQRNVMKQKARSYAVENLGQESILERLVTDMKSSFK